MPPVTSPRRIRTLVGIGFALGFALPGFAALGDRPSVSFEPGPGRFALIDGGRATPLSVDPQDWPGVVRVAGDLQADEARVSGLSPRLLGADGAAPTVVIVGTLGRSAAVDRLVREGKLEVSALRGQWESWLTGVVEHPFPGVDRALVIAGSDKRGTIYGVYDLSEQIGVSPWYWWDDVVPARHARVFVEAAPQLHRSPAVKYRGIFLNDEAPELTNWVREKFGTAPPSRDPPVPAGVANYGHEFYARIFEVLLRLRGNYLWPAMWNNAFSEDDPANARLADEYGVVMGTSHQEPMLRAQKEWDRRYGPTLGSWNYAREPALLQSFWRDGVRRNRAFESIYTLGLRGANDTEMAPGGPAANRAMLEGIVATQRAILRDEVNPDLARVPQLWCLYKEVQDYYEAGMRAPDDVTLLWADDNWGDLRRLPTAAERVRPGGAGIYYHLDYVGGPRNYKWIDTNPLPKIWDQLTLASAYGADRLWIANVGHFKGYERPVEFFLRMAWNPARWGPGASDEFLGLWGRREFGAEHGAEIGRLAGRLARINGRRKPELLAPGTYSLVNYGEAERVLVECRAVDAEARALQARLPAAQRDAFYELVAFPAAATSVVNQLYVAAGKNALYARQGRAGAAAWAQRVRELQAADASLMGHYNTVFAAGRWAHFMDQPHLGYTSWNDPPAGSLGDLVLASPAVPPAARLGVAVEGSAEAWPGGRGDARLPPFDSLNQQHQAVEVFDRGAAPLAFTVAASDPWILVSDTGGTAGAEDRSLTVAVDWRHAPPGASRSSLRIAGAGESVAVQLDLLNDPRCTPQTLRGFAENQGVVAIEPEHFASNTAAPGSRWVRVDGYGRTLSGVRAEAPIDAPPGVPGVASACLTYRFYLPAAGPGALEAITSPTLNFMPGRPLRFAAGLDDEAPQVVTVVPAGFRLPADRPAWEQVVEDNARTTRLDHPNLAAGYHTLRVWAVDPGVLIQRLLIDAGGLRPSYLGPPESLRGAVTASP